MLQLLLPERAHTRSLGTHCRVSSRLVFAWEALQPWSSQGEYVVQQRASVRHTSPRRYVDVVSITMRREERLLSS